MGNHNQNFKWLKMAFEPDANEIVEIMALAGVTISKTTANRWGRGLSASRTRIDRRDGEVFTDVRGKAIIDSEFDAFCKGLYLWSRQNSDENED